MPTTLRQSGRDNLTARCARSGGTPGPRTCRVLPGVVSLGFTRTTTTPPLAYSGRAPAFTTPLVAGGVSCWTCLHVHPAPRRAGPRQECHFMGGCWLRLAPPNRQTGDSDQAVSLAGTLERCRVLIAALNTCGHGHQLLARSCRGRDCGLRCAGDLGHSPSSQTCLGRRPD